MDVSMKVVNMKNYQNTELMGTCPHCNKEVMFIPIGTDILIAPENQKKIICGQRKCPNNECQMHVFVIYTGNTILCIYPSAKLDFDTSDIPENIVSIFKEALDCFSSGAFIATAIMIRRTLEEICSHHGCTGKTLVARLKELQKNVILPLELFEAMDELRLLGNDAAHIEAKAYNEINKNEADIAIEFTKETLKALYQYKCLLSKMRSLKTNSTS